MKKHKLAKQYKRNKLKRCIIVFTIIFMVLSVALSLIVKFKVDPNIEDVARIKAQVVVSRTVNKALSEHFKEDDSDKLFTVKNGNDGSMEMVQANSAAINIFMSQLSVNLQESFQNMDKESYEVSVGALLGSKFLSQTGPYVNLSIVPLSVSSMDFKTEFETQGINQTKYKIYIVLKCKVKVVAPFASKTFTTKNTVLVAEAVILGKVPDSYVEVPEEDILDVT
ncbi:MAG: sporulation protein YunB [Anaerovoracaceae bacterium]